ncbi:hypothetical protein ACOME3_006244 [Neoechinorhynchus agilis]
MTGGRYDILTDKNYPVVLSFMAVFGPQMELPSFPFELLESTLVDCSDDGRGVHRLLDYHYKLLRGLNPHYRNLNISTIPRALCRFLPSALATKLEETDYSQLEPNDRLKILLTMLELQLDQNAKMRQLLTTSDLGGLRPMPAGRAIDGRKYWIFTDSECTVAELMAFGFSWASAVINFDKSEIDGLKPELECLYKQIRHRYPDFECPLPDGMKINISPEDEAFFTVQSLVDQVSYRYPLSLSDMKKNQGRRSKRFDAVNGLRSRNETCCLCGHYGLLVLCDGCDYGWHAECLEMANVPDGDWYCDWCEQQRLCIKLSNTLCDLHVRKSAREASKLAHERKRLDRLANVSQNLDSLLRETETKAARQHKTPSKRRPFRRSANGQTPKRRRSRTLLNDAEVEYLDPRSRRKKEVRYTFEQYDEAIKEAVGDDEEEGNDTADAGDDGEWDAGSEQGSSVSAGEYANEDLSSGTSSVPESDWSDASNNGRNRVAVSARRSARIASKPSRNVYIEDDSTSSDERVVQSSSPVRRTITRAFVPSSNDDEDDREPVAKKSTASDIAWQRRVQLLDLQRSRQTSQMKVNKPERTSRSPPTMDDESGEVEGFLIRDILKRDGVEGVDQQ